MSQDTTPVTVRLPADLVARLDQLSAATRRPRSVYVREAIASAIDRIEWEQRIAQRAEDVRAGRIATISHDQLLAELGFTRDDLHDSPEGRQA